MDPLVASKFVGTQDQVTVESRMGTGELRLLRMRLDVVIHVQKKDATLKICVL
jgi:hypothetical protein